jgi:peptide/nickel transport system permease protein
MRSGLQLQRTRRRWRLNRIGGGVLVWISFVIIALYLLMALFPTWFYAYDPFAIDALSPLQAPSFKHIFGTDEYGRDIYSRIVDGARDTIFIGLGSAILAMIIGVPLGLIAGYYRGKADSVISLIVDGTLSFPSMLLAILVVSAWKPSAITLIVVIALVNFPRFTMIVRGNVLSLREREYVMAARLSGLSNSRIMFAEILPNCVTPIIVQASLLVGNAIVIETGLSYLGLGLQPPDPSWGGMLTSAQSYIYIAPWYSAAPGLAILLAVFAVNILGDYLSDKMDVRRRME